MSEDVNVTVNTSESPMDMWFKESMEAYDNLLKSAEKLYKKGEKRMTQLDDAPWVKQTELFGPDNAEEIEYSCPVCGAQNPEDFLFDRSGDIVGCNCCCHFKDAYEFMAEKRAEERNEWK